MNVDLAASLVAARSAQTQQSVEIAVFKKAHEMETDLLAMLMETALSAPPPGQGGVVDKRA